MGDGGAQKSLSSSRCCQGLKLPLDKHAIYVRWNSLGWSLLAEMIILLQNMAQGRLDSVVEVVSNAKREVGAVAYYNIDQRYCERLVQVLMPTHNAHKLRVLPTQFQT